MKRPSEVIENFINLINHANTRTCTAKEICEQCNKMTVDFNHHLELSGFNYKERAKLVTKQVKNLQERRKAKNEIEMFEPICTLLDSPEGKKFINKLTQTLGLVRKKEGVIIDNHRFYKKRITNSFDLESLSSKLKTKKELKV